MTKADLHARYVGAMLGFALGDCLGMPALPDREQQQAVLGHIRGPMAAPAEHPRWPGKPAGQATWLGVQAQQFLRNLAAGRPAPNWADLPPLPASAVAGDGAQVMPAEPVPPPGTAWPAALWGLYGLLHPGEPRQAAEAALAAWQGPPLTTSARTGVAMVAAALAAALAGDDTDGILAGAQVGSLAGRAGPKLGTAPSLPYRLQQTTVPLRAATDMEMQLQQLYDAPGASALAAEAVPTALAIVQAVTADPVWAALYGANLGGEAALIGALAAAIAGAAAGAGAIDSAWRHVAAQAWPNFDWEAVATNICQIANSISK